MLPVLQKYRDRIADNSQLSLAELIVRHHILSLPGAGEPKIEAEWFDRKLRAGDVVVMLDGFDEVKPDQRSGVADWINRQMTRYDKSVFILTSRPKAFQNQDPAHRLNMSTVLWVQKFETPQREDFVQKWYDCHLRLENADSFTPDIQQEAQEESESLLAQIE